MLKTDRCVIVLPQQQDYEDIRNLSKNADVRRYLGGPVDEQALKAGFEARLHSDADSYWIIRQASDNRFVGSVSLGLHHDGADIEVSYQLLPVWWGQGYGTEVVERVVRYAFESLCLSRVVAETQTANKASCRVLEKVGMHLERTVERFGAEQSIFSISNPKTTTVMHEGNG